MKKVLFVGLLIIFGVSFYSYWRAKNVPVSPQKSTVFICGKTYLVEVADTDDKRTRGLSDRAQIPANEGMLFVFETRDTYTFWMKDMRFPLDIIWIDGETVVDIDENVPLPLTATYLPRYQPQQPVDKVLEINAGETKKNGFAVGQKVIITLINSSL